MEFKKVRIFYNKKSGAGSSFRRVQEAFAEYWHPLVQDIAWYFPSSQEESRQMTAAAVRDGVDCLLIGGGDGTVSSIATDLIGTDVCMGVIPLGSGNGLARHFSESLDPVEAVEQLANGFIRTMDVGYVNNKPFLVSASAAWDASIVKAYNLSPVRGIGSYVLAGVYSFFEYSPKPVRMVVDETEIIDLDRPLLLTIGNLCGWGGGALIDKSADSADGRLELVAARTQDAAILLANLADVFANGLMNVPHVIYRKFTTLRIDRNEAQPIQLDGELHQATKNLTVSVKKGMIKILVPQKGSRPRHS